MEALELEKRVNKFAIIIITIIDAFMMFGYVSDFRKGNISMGYMLMVEILVLTTMVVSYVARAKWPAEFKHISLVGYMLVYASCVFGSHNDAVFTILFPIAIIYILFPVVMFIHDAVSVVKNLSSYERFLNYCENNVK